MNLTDLQNRGWLNEDSLHRAEILLADDNEETAKAPWIARFALGLGAWLAGIFLTAFVLTMNQFGNSEFFYLGLGLALIAGSIFLVRSVKKIFLKQLALACSVAGYILFLIDITDITDSGPSVVFAVIILCPLVYWFSNNAVLRFLSVAWVWGVWAVYAMDEGLSEMLLGGIVLSLLIASIGLSGWKSGSFLKPGVTASIIGMLVMIWLMFIEAGWPFRDFSNQMVLPAGILIALIFTGLLWHLMRPSDAKGVGWLIGFGVILLALSIAGAAGVVASLGLLTVAHARSDRWIGWLAILSLGVFLIHFYYHLGTTLMEKSLWMIGVGTALLILRFIALRSGKNSTLETESA